MKLYSLVVAFILCTFSGFGQTQTSSAAVQLGSVFEIGTPESNGYQYINIPKPNIIIKRGGFPHDLDLSGRSVVVTAIKEKENGVTEVHIKLKDGTRFFGSHKTLKVHFNEALEAGELKVL